MVARTQLYLVVLLIALALLTFLSSNADATDAPLQTTQVFLPLVNKAFPPPPEVAILQYRHVVGCCDSRDYIEGYVANLTSEPIYSVALEMPLHIYNYCDEEPCSESDTIERFGPAFDVTLPQQINPFKTQEYWQYKTGYGLGSVAVVSLDRGPRANQIHQSLTIVSSNRNYEYPFYPPFNVTGIVRNDTDETLQQARVVVYTPGECGWEETQLASTTLAPGETTTFQRTSYCDAETISLAGQGVVHR